MRIKRHYDTCWAYTAVSVMKRSVSNLLYDKGCKCLQCAGMDIRGCTYPLEGLGAVSFPAMGAGG